MEARKKSNEAKKITQKSEVFKMKRIIRIRERIKGKIVEMRMRIDSCKNEREGEGESLEGECCFSK